MISLFSCPLTLPSPARGEGFDDEVIFGRS